MECEHCGSTIQNNLAYSCNRCGQNFCSNCRLPETHECVGLALQRAQRELYEEKGETLPWFKDEFDLSNVDDSEMKTLKEKTEENIEQEDFVDVVENIRKNLDNSTERRREMDSKTKNVSNSQRHTASSNLKKSRSKPKPMDLSANKVPAKKSGSGDSSPDMNPDGSLNYDSNSSNKTPQPRRARSSVLETFSAISSTLLFPLRHPARSLWLILKVAIIAGVFVYILDESMFSYLWTLF